jgi:hypothetical protein
MSNRFSDSNGGAMTESDEGAARTVSSLVGCYQLQAAPEQILELRADGIAVLNREEISWSTDGALLCLGPEMVPYHLAGQVLTLDLGGSLVGWQRISAKDASANPTLPIQPSYIASPKVPPETAAPIATGNIAAPARAAKSDDITPPPNQGGDPTGIWDTPQGTLILRPNGTGSELGMDFRWEVKETRLKMKKQERWVTVPFSAQGDILVLGDGPVVVCNRAGIAGVWVGNESSLDPNIFLSFTQIVTLFPDGRVGYSKYESGANRTQVGTHLEQFQRFSNRGPSVESVGHWQNDGQRILIQFTFRSEPVPGWVDLTAMTMQLNSMGKLSGNEGGTVTFQRQ